MTTAAIIMAAGESTRMGTLKQLLPWGGKTLLAWQVDQMREAGIDDVVVVLGHEAAHIRDKSGHLPARIVLNQDYREGRASSLRRGAEAIDAADTVAVLSVDQPRPAAIVARLLQKRRDSAALIVMPEHGGRHGHPVLLDGSLLQELRDVTETDLGLRAVIDRHRDSISTVQFDNAIVLLDLNTRPEYESALLAFETGRWQL